MELDQDTVAFMSHVVAVARRDGTFIGVSQAEPGFSTADKAFKAFLDENLYEDDDVPAPTAEDNEFARRALLWGAEVMVVRNSYQQKLLAAIMEGVTKVNYRMLASLYFSYERVANPGKPFAAPGDTFVGRVRLTGIRAQRPNTRLARGVDVTFENQERSRVAVELPSDLQQGALDQLVLDAEYQASIYVQSVNQVAGQWYCRGIATGLIRVTDDGPIPVLTPVGAAPVARRGPLTRAVAVPEPQPRGLREISLTEDD